MADAQFLSQLTELLNQTTAPNSAAIKSASNKLQKEFYPLPQSVAALIQIMQQNQSQQIRQLGAVEVRKLISNHWDDLDESIRVQIRHSLLQSTLQEPSPLVRHASSRVISEIAKIDLPHNAWSDLPEYLHKAATSASASEREVGVYILYTLLDTMEETFGDKVGELFSLFSHTINDPESQAVRTNTLLALGKISEIIESQDHIQMFRQFIPGMVGVLKQLIDQNDEKAVSQAFEVFQTLLWVDSAIVSKSLGDLIQFMLEMAKEKNVDAEFRSLALQFLSNSVRFKKMKVQSLKVGPVLTSAALAIAGEEVEDMDDDDDENNVARLSLRLIDILSTSLPPSQVMNVLITEIPKYASSPNGNYRRAGLLALCVAVEGAPEFLSTQIKIVLPIILQGLSDSVLDVRVAALQALAQLADELQDTVSKEHQVLLPLVFNMMETTDLKVAKAACTALDAMIETMEKDVIARYLQTLMTRLLELLAQPSNDVTVKAPIIAAIGSAAHAAKNEFLPYFDSTIRTFEPYLSLTEGEKELDVKGTCFDSLGAMANAVGKDAFSPYAAPVVQAAYECLQTNHNRLRECVFLFFGVLAKVYGAEFAAFLPKIMPELFKCLEQDETGYEEKEDVDIGDADEEDIWQNLTVNSGLAMEKEIAADAIGDLVAGTKEAFLPYLEESSKVLIDLMSHFYEGIRKAAIGSLWRAVGTVYEVSSPPKWQPGLPLKVPLTETVASYSAMVRKATLEAFGEEDDRATATVVCDNLCEIIRLCGPGIVGNDLEPIATTILSILKKQHVCQTQDDDPEEEDIEDAAEYDILLVESAMDVIVSLAAAFAGDFDNYFRIFCPVILKYCSNSTAGERKAGVGALAEIVNGMKSSITPYTSQLLKAFVHRLSDESIEVRSNAVYGYGLLAEYSQSPQEIVTTYPKCLQRLQQCLVSDSDNDRCVANICGCVARMTYSHSEDVPLGDVLPALLYSLPLKDGCEENDPIFRLVVQLYKSNNSTIHGLTEQVLKVLEHIFAADCEDNKQFEFDETRQEVIELLRYINQSNPGAIKSSILLKAIQG
ncbi:armadillo-type protein [Lipomyces tetrasporus]|uniref:Armadillo-type protein n=1 Tax=Lipomyces tetrasporus TaxID=54092 RepID=A0AAD7QNK9_9ASCO|nr:armadillo-type protein [Lipomyces tetrasporus]KAJ8098310.1 armadillo-type protein [Lipomyces tetrasporus]